MRTIAVLSLWAAVSRGGEDPLRSYFSQHPEVRLLEARDLSGCPEAPKTGLQFSPSIRADLNGDKREDVAFVVVSKATPPTFGVVALHDGDNRTHFIGHSSTRRLRGVGIYTSPWGTYLFFGGCSLAETKGYEWAKRLYLPATIY